MSTASSSSSASSRCGFLQTLTAAAAAACGHHNGSVAPGPAGSSGTPPFAPMAAAPIGAPWPNFLESAAQLISENVSSVVPAAGNVTDLLSNPFEEFLTGSRFWVQRVLVPLIMVIGVIGNTITIVIMTRRRMRSSTNNYLAALAIFDMLYLIFIFVLSFAQYPDVSDPKYYYYWKLWPFSLMITDACSNSSVWLTVTFTIERFIVVSNPIRGKMICTESRSRIVVLCVVLICFTYTLPTPFEWLVVEALNTETNKTILKPTFSKLGENTTYKSIYYWLTAALFVFVPLLLLGIFNSFLIRSVHISRKERNAMTQQPTKPVASPYSSNGPSKASSAAKQLDPNSSKQENKITIMLIAVVILFFVCQLPTAVMLIFTSIHDYPENSDEYYLIRGLNNIFNFLMAINAAGNFLLYCLFSQRYRKTFVNVFCPCLKTNLGYFQSTYHQNTLYSKKGTAKEARAPARGDDDGQDLKVFVSAEPSPSPSTRRGSSPRTSASRTSEARLSVPGSTREESQKLLTIDERDIEASTVDKKCQESVKKSSAPLITASNTINLNSNSNYCDKGANGSPPSQEALRVASEEGTSTSPACPR